MNSETNATQSPLLRAGITVLASNEESLRLAAVKGAFALAVDVARSGHLMSSSGGFPEALSTLMRADPDVLLVPLVRSPHEAKALTDLVRAGRRVICGIAAGSTDDAITALRAFGLQDDVLALTNVHPVAAQ